MAKGSFVGVGLILKGFYLVDFEKMPESRSNVVLSVLGSNCWQFTDDV